MLKPVVDTAIDAEFVIVFLVVIDSIETVEAAVIVVAVGALILSGVMVPVTVTDDTAAVVVRTGMLFVVIVDCTLI